jgi:hypothetical protein
LPCPAGRSVPGSGGPERRRRPPPDGTDLGSVLGPRRTGTTGARAVSNGPNGQRGTAGHRRSKLCSRDDAPGRFRLWSRRPRVRVPSPNCRGPVALANEARSSHRGSASPITHSTRNRMRIDHPDDHPDDPSESIWIRPDRRGTQREQARSDQRRPVGRGAFGS